jgi:hypothetical protein
MAFEIQDIALLFSCCKCDDVDSALGPTAPTDKVINQEDIG